MSRKLKKNKKIILIIIIFVSLFFNLYQSVIIMKQNESITENNSGIKLSREERITSPWLNNSGFTSTDNWNLYKGDLGDKSDVDGNISQNQGNCYILGDYGIMKIDDPLNNTDWTAFSNPSLPILPDDYGINGSGCYVSHTWHESVDQTRNNPSIQWKRNITMPVNMSDYIITSASLSAIFNASVQALDHDGGGIEVFGDYTEGQNPPGDTQFGIGDFVTFYVLISDLENTYPFEIASNRTSNLGQDSPIISFHPDTPMNTITEDLLIAYLTSVLKTDNYNFTITLGLDIYSEDNEYNVDIDIWKALILRTLNLTFTFEKRIDQFTTVGWSQVGREINGDNVQISYANLKFKYKIDQIWTDASSNSEILILINNNPHLETIKLRNYIYSTAFIEADPEGFDITSLILKDINISVSIQVYLLDTFGLNRTITVSIDDVFLTISYVIFTPDEVLEPWIATGLFIISLFVVGLLSSYLIAYQTYLKYPVPVRKVRKYRKTLSSDKTPGVGIVSQKTSFSKYYHQELKKTDKFLKGAPMNGKIMRDKLLDKKEGELPK